MVTRARTAPHRFEGRALHRSSDGLFSDIGGAIRAGREAERLFQLSEAELERRGLSRNEVVHHAFREYLNLTV
ncbi:hypothetical protein RDV64_14575 [Acuticoccus sp. MNP-M23]|uniref:hypothetical protein n=1 Tax=Acuticoccus sp. MNP-M23 TaxID=3072793 RepID=UPI002814AFB8|nr:hypothetical protein [Acuticoccus sp. MNP-M23]WMS41304.1 hypothetical protein RDV64_14575 [Acuticoccus sp. MNP-M23]